jgi:hypothetical protein
MDAATIQMALTGSPRRNATTARQHAPMMAMTAQTILLPMPVGFVATISMKISGSDKSLFNAR